MRAPLAVPLNFSPHASKLLAAALLLSVSFAAIAQQPPAASPAPKPSFTTPALSPDGAEIAFASGGAIWTAPTTGGDAHLLISSPADDSRPLFSPDGKRLTFQSTRTGADDIYILTLSTGVLQRITYTDAPVALDAWSRDGQWLYFTSSANDVGGQGDIFRVRASGGTPLEVSAERYLNEFESAPSPDGKSIALLAKGISSSQWWRNGNAHIDDTELWLKPIDPSSPTQPGYRLLIPADAKHAWPMWSPDARTLYFMSDKSGPENIWQSDASTGAAKRITTFTAGRCLWPTISYDGKSIVFERNFAIWKLDTHTGHAAEVPIALRGLPSTPGIEHTPISSWSSLAVAPDGKKVAVIGHGEVFAASSTEPGEPQRLTNTPSAEDEPQWSPDSTRLVYTSERDSGSSLYEYDLTPQSTAAASAAFAPGAEHALTHSTNIDVSPTWSPDGKSIAYIRNRKELHVLTLPTSSANPGKPGAAAPPPTDRIVATGELGIFSSPTLAWSPDSHWIVFVPTGLDGFTNLYAVPADGSAPARPITFLADGENASHIAWSPDGKYILFDTAQRAETPHLARVDLVPHLPIFREDQFRDLFQKLSTPGAPDLPPIDRTHSTETTPATAPSTTTPSITPEPAPSAADAAQKPAAGTFRKAPKKSQPTRIVFAGIRDRLTLLPIDLDLRYPVISPDGKTLAFLAEVSGSENIYTYSLDELSHERPTPRQLTSTPGSKSRIAFTPDSKTIFYLQSGGGGDASPGSVVRSVSLTTRDSKTLALSTAIDVDFDQEKMVVFNEAWTTLDQRFWNPNFNGVNWPALRDQWRPYIEGVRTGPELRRDINLLIGELDSSHSGISKRSQPAVHTGRLGLRFERQPFEQTGALIIREIVPLGPADLGRLPTTTLDSPAMDIPAIHVGDRLLAVDGQPITSATNLDALLQDTVGKRVVLAIAPQGKASAPIDVIVRPVSLQVESGLLYRAWVESRRAYVDKISHGQLGYVHLAAMGDPDLAQLYIDLDVQNQSKKGVVIDVRNNNGGYVNGRVIDVFARRNYLLMTPRDGATVPSRQALGQRALGLPTVLVINQSTLSDGEDFTQGYRALHLGKTVGTPTAGWIIFTGAQRLIDGSSVRVPSSRIDTTAGQNMEMHPRPVDVEQDRPLGETETSQDAQLEKAVQVLLDQLK